LEITQGYWPFQTLEGLPNGGFSEGIPSHFIGILFSTNRKFNEMGLMGWGDLSPGYCKASDEKKLATEN
jgi:hypothetical protein